MLAYYIHYKCQSTGDQATSQIKTNDGDGRSATKLGIGNSEMELFGTAFNRKINN